ncbi:MAG: hypothetical protein ABIF71_01935 [Planctomycetota bacterium]
MIANIGLTGLNAAGKGVVSGILAGHGYSLFSLSDVVREEARRLGRGVTRAELILTGNAMRAAGGPGVLAERIIGRLQEWSVIDSIRNPAEVAVLRGVPGFRLLGVQAPAAVRFERMRRRGRLGDAVTLERFMELEVQDNSNDAAGLQIQACLALADAVIDNNGPLADLEECVRRFCGLGFVKE